MAGPLDPDAGRRIYPDNSWILSPSDHPITPEELGEFPDDYAARIARLQERAEEALEASLGPQEYSRLKELDPFNIPVWKLPRETRDELQSEMSELVGLKRLVQQGLGPDMFVPYFKDTAIGQIPERSPAGRYTFEDPSADVRATRIAQSTVRAHHAAGIADKYTLSGTWPREEVISQLRGQIAGGINTSILEGEQMRPGKIAVFDVESPGLNSEEGIWQLSAKMIQDGQEIKDQFIRNFDNPKMRQFGEIGPNRQTLQSFVHGDRDPVAFEEGMRDFLEYIKDADFVAGHNLPFDYKALRYGLINTPAYTTNPEFKELADSFLNRFSHIDSGTIGDFIDTAALSRQLLPKLAVAEELEGLSPYQYSLQNILLQTNLLARIREEVGDDGVQDLLAQGTHFADVDVSIETPFFKYLQEMGQGGRGLEMYPTGEYHGMSPEERNIILKSRPFTPNLPLRNIGDLNEITRQKAMAAGILEEGAEDTGISPLENMIIASRDLSMASINPSQFSVPSVAKRFINKFQIGDIIPDETLAIANRAGIWNRLFGKNVTTKGTIARGANIPTPEQYEEIQRKLYQANVPLAGIELA